MMSMTRNGVDGYEEKGLGIWDDADPVDEKMWRVWTTRKWQWKKCGWRPEVKFVFLIWDSHAEEEIININLFRNLKIVSITLCQSLPEEKSGESNHKDLSQENYKVGHLVKEIYVQDHFLLFDFNLEEYHLVDEEAAEDVGGDQGEGVLGGLAEVRAHHCCHDVGIPVESFFLSIFSD